MSESNDDDSADDERSLFAKILRRSADELEDAPTDDGGDPDTETEQRADDEDDEDDENGGDADPIDRALAEGTIETAQAGKLRDAAERMAGDPEPVIEEVAEGNLDTDRAVEILESAGDYPDDDPADDEDEGVGMEGRSDEDGDAPDFDADALDRLSERLDAVDELGDRLDDIESRLDDLADSTVDEDDLEQRLASVGETLDEEFEDLIQRADIVGTPDPQPGDTEDRTLADSVPIGGD